jgi:hypothetical protein
MATTATNSKQLAHELIERMSPGQVSAVVGLLEVMLDPVSAAIANAPIDDEPVSDAEKCDITEARAEIAKGKIISHEKILAELGLTSEDFARMGQTPLKPASTQPVR